MKIQDINVLTPEDVEKEFKAARDQKRNYFIFPHRLKGGQIRTVEVYSSPYVDASNTTLLISIIHDIEDKSVAEKELLEYKVRLEELVGRQVASIVAAGTREKWLIVLGGIGLSLLFAVAVRKHLQTELFRQKFEMEKKCRELSARFEFLVQNAHDMILLADSEGRVVEANREALHGYGHTREEMLGMRMDELRVREEREPSDASDPQCVSSCGVYEEMHRRKDGSVFPAEVSSSEFGIADGVFCQHIVRDISLRKRVEEERKAIIELLHKSNADKDMLFSIIAHDLRSPMTSIVALTDILKDNLNAFTPEDLHKICVEMNRNTKNVMLLLDDLLQWARMNQGGIDFSPSLYGLRSLVDESVQPLLGAAEGKNVSISVALREDDGVYVDLPMVNTVIRNVVSNAIKFTHPGGRIVIDSEPGNGFVQVRVGDDGIGIDSSLLGAIFEHGSAKRRPGTAGEKGSGLGLILCREFIEKHGGSIRIESARDKGTDVFFTLPTKTAHMV